MPLNFLTARWEKLIMANYAVPPQVLQPYLPAGTELDFYEGQTFVSLVGFMFTGTRIFGLPSFGWGSFEEVNLRFYVTRTEADGMVKRGVVFINETVPYKIVAWMANKLYKEHYTAVPTRHEWSESGDTQQVNYYWKKQGQWNHLKLKATSKALPMVPGSLDEFILEHYFGYTRVNDAQTLEYRVQHPRWDVFPVLDGEIQCDFEAMYGRDFEFLNRQQPVSVCLAAGSAVAVAWKRKRLMP